MSCAGRDGAQLGSAVWRRRSGTPRHDKEDCEATTAVVVVVPPVPLLGVVEGRVDAGDEVELVQAASISARTTIAITLSLRTVIIVSPIVLSGPSGNGGRDCRLTRPHPSV